MKIDLDELERKARAVLADGCESFADAANRSHAYELAAGPPMTLALVAIAKALVEFDAVHVEIDRVDPDAKLDPMSPILVELGGKSIAAWQRVEEALKAVKP